MLEFACPVELHCPSLTYVIAFVLSRSRAVCSGRQPETPHVQVHLVPLIWKSEHRTPSFPALKGNQRSVSDRATLMAVVFSFDRVVILRLSLLRGLLA